MAANPNFPGPSFNKLIDKDPQIKKVSMENAEWGARKSGMPTDVKNDMTISHVGNKS